MFNLRSSRRLLGALISYHGYQLHLPWAVLLQPLFGRSAPGLILAVSLAQLRHRASLYGSFDCKHLYILSAVLFEVGSALCGSANMIDVLIFGRAIAGLGGVGLYVGVMTLLSSLTTASERPIYLAATSLVWGFGSVLG